MVHYCCGRSKAKEAEALALGAKAVIPSGDEEAMKAAAGTLDGIIDTVSAKHDFNQLLDLLAPRGRLVVVSEELLPPFGTGPRLYVWTCWTRTVYYTPHGV
jgi:D-arabinose 1-dehydrogenase-like Zn-dependent alcohol dehydrogenase